VASREDQVVSYPGNAGIRSRRSGRQGKHLDDYVYASSQMCGRRPASEGCSDRVTHGAVRFVCGPVSSRRGIIDRKHAADRKEIGVAGYRELFYRKDQRPILTIVTR